VSTQYYVFIYEDPAPKENPNAHGPTHLYSAYARYDALNQLRWVSPYPPVLETDDHGNATINFDPLLTSKLATGELIISGAPPSNITKKRLISLVSLTAVACSALSGNALSGSACYSCQNVIGNRITLNVGPDASLGVVLVFSVPNYSQNGYILSATSDPEIRNPG